MKLKVSVYAEPTRLCLSEYPDYKPAVVKLILLKSETLRHHPGYKAANYQGKNNSETVVNSYTIKFRGFASY